MRRYLLMAAGSVVAAVISTARQLLTEGGDSLTAEDENFLILET